MHLQNYWEIKTKFRSTAPLRFLGHILVFFDKPRGRAAEGNRHF